MTPAESTRSAEDAGRDDTEISVPSRPELFTAGAAIGYATSDDESRMRRLLGGFFHHEHHVANLELTLGRHQGQLAGIASGLQVAQASLDTA